MSLLGAAALSVGANVASGLLNKATDSIFANSSTKRSIAANKELMSYQQGLQRSANLRAMSDKRDSLERAGINLNAENGFQPVQAVPTSGLSSPKAEGQGIDLSSLSSIGSYRVSQAQAGVLDEEKRLKKAEADLKERELKGTKEVDAWYSRVIQPVENVDYDTNGNLVFGASVPNEGSVDGAQMSGSLPNVSVSGSKLPSSTTKEGVEARKLARKRIEKELAELNASTVHNELQSSIEQHQIDDPEVMEAFFKQPYWQQQYVQEQINELISRQFYNYKAGEYQISAKDLNILENNMSNKGIIQGVEKDIDSGGSIRDVGKKVIKGLIKMTVRKVFGSDN